MKCSILCSIIQRWKKPISTYQMDTYENCWNSLFTINRLFHEIVLFVGEKLGYKYNMPEYEKVNDYLMKVRNNRFPETGIS